MDFDLQWLLIGLPAAFALGWVAARLDLRQWRRDAPSAYVRGLVLLLGDQQDKAVDTFIEAVQHDPGATELHFALGSLFRRRGEYERAVRVHQHLLGRGDLQSADRDRARYALAQDYMKAGLFDRAEEAYRALQGSSFEADAQLALLVLAERSRDWARASELAAQLEDAGRGSFATRIAHHACEQALQADEQDRPDEAAAALQRAPATRWARCRPSRRCDARTRAASCWPPPTTPTLHGPPAAPQKRRPCSPISWPPRRASNWCGRWPGWTARPPRWRRC